MQKILLVIGVVIVLGVIGYFILNRANNNLTLMKTDEPVATREVVSLETSLGAIKIALYQDDAPKTVGNFKRLIKDGFYDGLTFHRVIRGFMIQGGDPNGDGTGGPGYTFEDELNPGTSSYKEGYKKGVIAMANAGPNTNGSQFFIMLENTSLPHSYTIFGKVIGGQEVVDAIGNIATGANDKPLEPVLIKKAAIANN